MRPILITGGAPRVPVDAVRFLSVRASGSTARAMAAALHTRGCATQLLLPASADVVDALTYDTRADLDTQMRRWVESNREGVVVMSAAVNDYQVDRIEREIDGRSEVIPPGAKAASGAEALVIRLRPAPKLIDQLPVWGHRGPLVAFKYEAAETVIAAAQALRQRTGAVVVVANSLCGHVQALVDAQGVTTFVARQALLTALVERVQALAHSSIP